MVNAKWPMGDKLMKGSNNHKLNSLSRYSFTTVINLVVKLYIIVNGMCPRWKVCVHRPVTGTGVSGTQSTSKLAGEAQESINTLGVSDCEIFKLTIVE